VKERLVMSVPYNVIVKIRILAKEITQGNLKRGSFTRDFERLMKEGSGNGASLSVGAL
jgi:hypothetical protein